MIAIHNSNVGFHKRWREYCVLKSIKYKDVDCYANNILEQLNGCDALMWHYWQTSSKDFLKAKRILFALEHAGFIVFPDFKTAWHFDDKIAQKYLLEALNLPLVKSYHFIDKLQALKWVDKTSYPKVFKLKGGAGSVNVRLVKNKTDAKVLIDKAFKSGFSQYDKTAALRERFRKYNEGEDTFFGVLKSLYRVFDEPQYSRVIGVQKNEVYFQDFIPENEFDIRIIIIDNKAFAVKRLVRNNDFRASGSGKILFSKNHFDSELIKMSFDIASKLDTQCCAFDFVMLNEKPKIVEISYGYAIDAYDNCEGYWDNNLVFHEGKFDSTNWMVDLIIKQVDKKNIHSKK